MIFNLLFMKESKNETEILKKLSKECMNQYSIKYLAIKKKNSAINQQIKLKTFE